MNLADIRLRTSNSGPAAGALGLNSEFCSGRCRLEWETAARGRVVLVRDGQATWLYSSVRNEFVKGQALRDVAGSVSSSMLLAVHLTPLMSFDEQQWTGARLLESEIFSFGSERRECEVVEASLKSQGLPLLTPPSSLPPADPYIGSTAAGSLAFLGLQALSAIIAAPVPRTVDYFASAQAGDFPRIRLWIDKERGLVLRRTVTENARRFVQTAQSRVEIPVQLRLTDTFTIANVGAAVPEALFRFEPPSEAKQVPRQ
jgi:outer membrane lipoprotein-sorting protein